MKKIIFVLISVLLICSLTVLVCSAEEQNVTEVENSSATGVKEADKATDGVEEESAAESEKFYSEWIDKITDSTLWVNILTVLSGVIATIAFVRSKFGTLISGVGTLAKGQISKSDLKEIVSGELTDVTATYEAELKRMGALLEQARANEDKIYVMLAVFISNAKINPCARAEILKILSGVKEGEGSIEDAVAAANEAIGEAEAAEAQLSTPALDAITQNISSDNGYMELG